MIGNPFIIVNDYATGKRIRVNVLQIQSYNGFAFEGEFKRTIIRFSNDQNEVWATQTPDLIDQYIASCFP